MIKYIIKRDGTVEEFDANKVNGWSEWASKHLDEELDWSEVVLNAYATLPETCTSEELQNSLIAYCLGQQTWEYNRMAGRLYSALLLKIIHNSSTYPTIKEVHDLMMKDNIIRKPDYTDEEYEKINDMIDHNRNMNYPHYSIHQNRHKYALQNRTSKKEYETSQFIYMRIAMAAAEHEDKKTRLIDVKNYYDIFSKHKGNIPTPFYVNALTFNAAFASCCVHTTKDTAESLAAADHITYMMTVMSAGIGVHYKTRSLRDPVKNGLIEHQGKVPYIRANATGCKANLQNGRGGALNVYFTAYDPEVESLIVLKNPMTPDAKQVRQADYSLGSNRLVVKQFASGGDIALFSYYDAPELYEAMYSSDQDYFEELYEEFLKSDKPRKMVSARSIILLSLSESFTTARQYEHFTDHLNTHTPFKDKIYSGNLCVTGDSYIDTINEDGVNVLMSIKDFVDSWKEDSNVLVKSYDTYKKEIVYSKVLDAGLTGKSAVYEIIDNIGVSIKATPDHKIYTSNKGYVSAKDIICGDTLVRDTTVNTETSSVVTAIKVHPIEIDVYDIKVENTECFFANSVLVHNCVEIALPTAGFDSVKQLYEPYDDSLNFIHYKIGDKEFKEYSFNTTLTKNRGILDSKDLRLGDVTSNGEITKIVERSTAPEIALCNVGGIIIPNIESEEDYANTAYYMLKLVRFGVLHSKYVFENLKDSAKGRMSAGIGIVGLAHHMAKNKMKYSTQEGRNFIHEVSETHYWHLANASLRIGKEYGNAEWMHKTKWPEGWTPLSTYTKEVDKYVTVENKRDWESFSKKVIENKGIAHSVLSCELPAESCLKYDQLIKVYEGDNIVNKSLEDLFKMTGHDLDTEITFNQELFGGKWYDLPNKVFVDTIEGKKPVSSVWLNGLSNYLTIEFEDGYKISATHSHKLLCKNENKNCNDQNSLEWIKAIDLDNGSYVCKQDGTFIRVSKINISDNKVPCLDINVDVVHSYILDNGIVSHNSSISSATTNGIYPIRKYSLKKTNDTLAINYVAPDSTRLKDEYELAYDIDTDRMIEVYAIKQKWTDQSISADYWRRLQKDENVKTSEMSKHYIKRWKLGVKQKYYQNSLTGKDIDLVNDNDEKCEGCTI